MPQSGSVITGIETHAFGSLINDILKIDNCDFFSLVEMRTILEINAARFAALRRTDHDLEKIEKAMNAYIEKSVLTVQLWKRIFNFISPLQKLQKIQF